MILEIGFCFYFILVSNRNSEKHECNLSSHVTPTELLGELLKNLQIISEKKEKKCFHGCCNFTGNLVCRVLRLIIILKNPSYSKRIGPPLHDKRTTENMGLFENEVGQKKMEGKSGPLFFNCHLQSDMILLIILNSY